MQISILNSTHMQTPSFCQVSMSIQFQTAVSFAELLVFRFPVYRFRGIHYGVVAAKTKLALTLSSLALIPYKYWQFINDDITVNHFAAVSAFASFTTVALVLFCRWSF